MVGQYETKCVVYETNVVSDPNSSRPFPVATVAAEIAVTPLLMIMLMIKLTTTTAIAMTTALTTTMVVVTSKGDTNNDNNFATDGVLYGSINDVNTSITNNRISSVNEVSKNNNTNSEIRKFIVC